MVYARYLHDMLSVLFIFIWCVCEISSNSTTNPADGPIVSPDQEKEFQRCTEAITPILEQARMTLAPELSMKVTFKKVNVVKIKHVEERESRVKIQISFVMHWYDHRLVHTNISGCENLPDYSPIYVFPTNRLWFPWFYLDNGHEETTVEQLWTQGISMINRGGYITWYTMYTFDTFCDLSLKYFPMDTQHCELQLQFVNANLSLGKIFQFKKPHGKGLTWTITKYRHHRTDLYGQYILEYTIRRNIVYNCVTILLPMILMSPLSSLTFVLPPESGEKLSVALTTLLTYFILAVNVANIVPQTPEIPLLLLLFSFLVASSLGASVASAVIAQLAARDQPPAWLPRLNSSCLLLTLCLNVGAALLCIIILFSNKD